MLSFLKGIFYLTLSVVIIATYIFTTTYFERLDNRILEKQNRMDKYYEEEFLKSYKMCSSNAEWVKSVGEKSLDEVNKNALYDGYSKADIQKMNSKGFEEAQKY